MQKMDELGAAMKENNVDIACITEIWLKKLKNEYPANLPTFRVTFCIAETGRTGGVVAEL